jgi:hypothetical protein
LCKNLNVKAISLYGAFHINDSIDCLNKIGRNLRDFVYFLHVGAPAQKLCYGIDIIITELFYVIKKLLSGIFIKFLMVNVVKGAENAELGADFRAFLKSFVATLD